MCNCANMEIRAFEQADASFANSNIPHRTKKRSAAPCTAMWSQIVKLSDLKHTTDHAVSVG
jgi:hypothetical protein